jgi:hypothetical protein
LGHKSATASGGLFFLGCAYGCKVLEWNLVPTRFNCEEATKAVAISLGNILNPSRLKIV